MPQMDDVDRSRNTWFDTSRTSKACMRDRLFNSKSFTGEAKKSVAEFSS